MTNASTPSITQTNLITYEMPLNDAIRICLRLENLFHQFDQTVNGTSSLCTKNAMDAVLKILEVTDRPDIKSKLSQTLTQYANTYSQMSRSPKVDIARLQAALSRIEKLNHYLHTHPTRIGDPLRQNDFLYQIRSNLANPGGACDHRLPAYMLWQNKSPAEKSKDLNDWMVTFQPLRNIMEAILQLTRESTPMEPAVADNGFFVQTLNPAVLSQLVRVSIDPQLNLFPEFGAGKHRLTIRFLEPHYFGDGKSTQTTRPVSFLLACCKI